MEAKHTPGPWKVVGSQDGTRVRVIDAHDDTVCSWPFSDSYCPSWRANANVIAAAPELLAACKALVVGLESGGVPGQLVSEVRDAIAKAEVK